MGKIAVLGLRRVVVAGVLVLLVATACGSPVGSVDAGASGQVGEPGQAGGTVPSSVPGTAPVQSTTRPVLPPRDLADAKDEIVENLGHRGLEVDEATCVFDGLEERFQGPELAYVVGILAAPELTEETVADIVRSSRIDLEVSYDAPDRLSELITVCQPSSAGTSAPAGLDQAN